MPRHLDELIVHRFRGLRDVSLTDLRGVNLFVGANDSGKTSLLEALSIFVQPLNIRVWLDAGLRRDRRLPWHVALESLFPHFVETANGDAKREIDLSGEGESIDVRRSGARLTKTSRLKTDAQDTQYEEPGVEIEVSVATYKGSLTPERFLVWRDQKAVDLPPPRRSLKVQMVDVDRYLPEQLSDVTLRGLKQQTVDLLQKVYSQIKDIEVLTPDGVTSVYLAHSRAGLAPLAEFGDGIRRALSIALALPKAANGILLIDEIEASIHVSALGPLFKWLVEGCAEFNVQLFATTHSLEAVDAILESNGNESDLAAFRLRQKATGITCQRLSGDLLHRLRYERGPRREGVTLHYGHLIVEGPQDLAFAGALLKRAGFRGIRLKRIVDAMWHPIIPKEFAVKDDLTKRVPVPAFFQSGTHSIAVQVAGGITRAAEAAEETLAQIPISVLQSIGFILDADTEEPPAERFRKLAADLSIALPPNPGEISTGPPRTGAFIIPDNQSQGALEHLLIDCARIAYPKLLESAHSFIDPIATDPGAYGTDVASAVRESAWKLKATVGHVANVLKPGKTTQVSIEDNRWVCDDSIAHTRIGAVDTFLRNLFALSSA
jgi:predicted ATPase